MTRLPPKPLALRGLLFLTATLAAVLAATARAQTVPLVLPTNTQPAPSFDAHIRAAAGALKAHLPREAAMEYQAALRLRPGDADAHYALGGVYERLARLQDAEREYRWTVRLDPGHAAAHSALAGMLDDRGQLAAALAQSAQALTILPGDARLHCNQGGLLAEAKRWPDARREYETALRLSPDLAEARRGLAALPPAASRTAPKPPRPSAHRREPGEDGGFEHQL